MKSTSLLVSFCLSIAQFGSAVSIPHYNLRAANEISATGAGCASGVHMIIARASTEAPGAGIIGGVATMVVEMVPESDFESVDYPATLEDYFASEAAGIAGMQKLIQNYTTKCPNSKYALLGYSQGAQVVGDVLGGTSEGSGQSAGPGLSPDLAKKLVAVIQMGDPSHVPAQPQNVGNSTHQGVFPRENTAALAPYTGITQSYCDSGDPFCDSGSSPEVHRGYVKEYGVQAAIYIQGKAMNGTVSI